MAVATAAAETVTTTMCKQYILHVQYIHHCHEGEKFMLRDLAWRDVAISLSTFSGRQTYPALAISIRTISDPNVSAFIRAPFTAKYHFSAIQLVIFTGKLLEKQRHFFSPHQNTYSTTFGAHSTIFYTAAPTPEDWRFGRCQNLQRNSAVEGGR